MAAPSPSAPHSRSPSWRRVAGLLAVLLAAGCSAVQRVSPAAVSDLLPAERTGWNRPLRFTRGPGAQFNGDLHAPTGRLAYVWDREGEVDVFAQEDILISLELPRRLAPHSACDRWPRLSPDGKRLLFTSTRQDSAGDIWMLPVKKGLFGAGLRRLTDRTTCDDQPCWHPDGDRIFYASSPALGEPFDLWAMAPGRPPVRLTERGGQMPDCSPDGRYLVFVSRRESGDPDLWVLRLGDRACARLTSGPELDLYPCWSADGGRVFFARLELDTSSDGRLDRSDASAIFSVAFSPEVFAGGGTSPVRQLTPYSSSESYPRPVAGGFLYTRALGEAGGGIFALGRSGEVPDFDRVSAFREFARRAQRDEGTGPYRRLMAWQNVLWAARSDGEVVFDLPERDDAAVAWLRIGQTLRELGHREPARRAFQALVAEYPAARRYVGMARVELLAMARHDIEASLGPLAGGRVAQPRVRRPWQEHLDQARAIELLFMRYAQEAENGGETAEADSLRATCALARLERGRTHLAGRDYAAALESFEAVREEYPEQREAGTQALLAAAEVYAVLDRPDVLRETYLRVLEEYPDLAPYASRAASLAVETIVRPSGRTDERLAGLRDIVERYSEVPVLPALAQNRIGDLFYAGKDHLRAIEEYRRTIERFPSERQQVAAAYLAIGRIRAEQEDYGRAVASFERMRELFEGSGGELYERARRGFANALLLKAKREMDLDDVALALNTYSRLLEFDPELVAAQRGVIECHAGLGRVGEAVLAQRALVEGDPRDHRAHYALALAYSYYGPSDWVGDRRATARRLRIDREALRLVGLAILTASDVAYYHQLRGFLLNRLAVATGEAGYKVRALDAYMAALGAGSPQDDPANWPNLLFNVGEGCMLVDQLRIAYHYYRQAVDAGFTFVGAHGEASLTRISTSAMAAGDYAYAIEMLNRALDILRDPDSGPNDPMLGLRREAETLDRIALAYHLNADYLEAVEHYRLYAQAVERLAARRAEAGAYRRNLLRAHRNLAVNLYLAAQDGVARPRQLAEAYELLESAVQQLGRTGVVEWEERAGPGLLTIDIQVALGERKAAAPFDAAAETRLLYTYMGRISAAAGDYAGAVRYLEKKLQLYPDLPDDTEQTDLLTEQAVVWTQIGGHQIALGDLAAAADAYRRALALEARARNLPGEAQVAVSLGRIALRMADEGEAPADLHELLRFALRTHLDLLRRMREQEARYLVRTEAALNTNLAPLLELTGAQGDGG